MGGVAQNCKSRKAFKNHDPGNLIDLAVKIIHCHKIMEVEYVKDLFTYL